MTDLIGELTIPAAAKLKPGDVVHVTGPGSWELIEGDDPVRAAAWAEGYRAGVDREVQVQDEYRITGGPVLMPDAVNPYDADWSPW